MLFVLLVLSLTVILLFILFEFLDFSFLFASKRTPLNFRKSFYDEADN